MDSAGNARGPSRRVGLVLASIFLCLLTATDCRADDWPGWRSNGSGISTDTSVPLLWDETTNVAWKAAIPGKGMSSPIVSGDRVFVTTGMASNYRQMARDHLWRMLFVLGSGVILMLVVVRLAPRSEVVSPGQRWLPISGQFVCVCVFLALAALTEYLINTDWSVGSEWVSGSITRTWLWTSVVGGTGLAAAMFVSRPQLNWRLTIALLTTAAALYATLSVPDYRQYVEFPSQHVELLLLGFGGILGIVFLRRRGLACGLWLLVFTPLLALVAYLHAQLDATDYGHLRFRILIGMVTGLALAVVTNSVARLLTTIAECRNTRATSTVGMWARDLSCGLLVAMVGLQFYCANHHLPSLGIKRVLMCMDAHSGDLLWQTGFFTAEELIVTAQSHASPTPVTDGERVYAYFGNAGILCTDMQGRQLWINRNLQLTTGIGAGSSPLLYRDSILLACDHNEQSYVVSLDTATGREQWRTARETPASFATPIIATFGDQDQFIVAGGEIMTAYDPRDGRELWATKIPTAEVVPSLVVKDDIIFVGGYWMGDTLGAWKFSGDSGQPKPRPLWATRKKIGGYASPLVTDRFVYMVSNQGIATCLDATTGKTKWRKRLQGNFTASPVLINGHVCFLSREGKVTVMENGPRPIMVGQNSIAETCFASPAIANGQLFLRSTQHLWCIAKNSATHPQAVESQTHVASAAD